MSDFALPLQEAIFGVLDADEALTAMLATHVAFARSAIYDIVPQPTDTGAPGIYPLITLGDDTLGEWGTDTASGAAGDITVRVWSRQRGYREAKQIAARVRALLDRVELQPEGCEFIGLDWQREEAVRDSDGLTVSVVQTYAALLDQEGFGEPAADSS